MSRSRGFDVCYFGMLPMAMKDTVSRNIVGKAVGPKLNDIRAKGRLFCNTSLNKYSLLTGYRVLC